MSRAGAIADLEQSTWSRRPVEAARRRMSRAWSIRAATTSTMVCLEIVVRKVYYNFYFDICPSSLPTHAEKVHHVSYVDAMDTSNASLTRTLLLSQYMWAWPISPCHPPYIPNAAN